MIYQCQSQIYINKHGVWSHCNIGHCITYIGKYIFTSSDFSLSSSCPNTYIPYCLFLVKIIISRVV